MNQTQAKHTPITAGPWLAKGAEIYSESTGRTVAVIPGVRCDEHTPADAQFIVKACNCHDELLEACKAILAGFDAGVFVRDISKDGTSEWYARLLPHLAALGKAEAAIQKAEGQG